MKRLSSSCFTGRGRRSPFTLSLGSSYATEAASSGVYCVCWVSNAAAVRREMEAGTARWARGANARDNHKSEGKSSLRSGLPLPLKVFSRALFPYLSPSLNAFN